jgi:hypothetical protein
MDKTTIRGDQFEAEMMGNMPLLKPKNQGNYHLNEDHPAHCPVLEAATYVVSY